MIIREWRGRAERSKAEAYPSHFLSHVAPGLKQVEGFLGAHLSQRTLNDEVEFVVFTRWTSMEAIQAFAGADVGKAVVEPGAVAALRSYDDRVQHYEVIAEL
jgi:heme-degrading monooxygenase HmoA